MRTTVVLGLLVALSLALYANAFGNDFVFDDVSTVRANRGIRSARTLADLVRSYRPVRHLSFAIDRAIAGYEPWIYHVSNAVYHALAAFAVFLVLRRLAGADTALAGALLFVAHPVHTESVAYISGRRDLLTTLFFLLGFLFWLEFDRTARRRWLAGAAMLYALALGAKEMAITLPAICALYDLLLAPDRVRRRLAIHAVALVLAIAAVAVIAHSDAWAQAGWHGGSIAANAATSIRLVVHYAGLLLFPMRLLADYSHEAFPLSRSLLEPRVLLALASVAAGLGIAVLLRRRAPLVSFGILWFLLTLLPVLHVVPFHELAAEHYLYLPSVGFCLLAGLLFARFRARRGPRPAWAALGVVLLAFSVRTVVRNRDWRDEETFWRTVAETAPDCARAHVNLGILDARRRDWPAAVARFERAVTIRPHVALGRWELAKAYRHVGREKEWREEAEEALRVARAERWPTVNPGTILFRLGRFDEAANAFEAEIQVPRNLRQSLEGLVSCHKMLRRHAEALAACERLLRLQPDDPRRLRDAAELAEACGESGKAREYLRRAREAEAAR